MREFQISDFRLILGAAGVDVFVPEEDAAGHAFDVFESVLAEDLGELHRSAAAFAVNDDFLVFVAFEFADALGKLLQGDELCGGDGGDGLLAGEASIDEKEI